MKNTILNALDLAIKKKEEEEETKQKTEKLFLPLQPCVPSGGVIPSSGGKEGWGIDPNIITSS